MKSYVCKKNKTYVSSYNALYISVTFLKKQTNMKKLNIAPCKKSTIDYKKKLRQHLKQSFNHEIELIYIG